MYVGSGVGGAIPKVGGNQGDGGCVKSCENFLCRSFPLFRGG